MRRDLIVSLVISFLLHAGVALSSYLPKKTPAAVVPEPIPTIELLAPPPPPEPEEQETVADVSDSAAESPVLAPPMQADMVSAVIDSPFVQKLQAPPPPGLPRSQGAIVIPVGRPSLGGGSGGSGLRNVFNLADLDQAPEPQVKINPVYPFDLRRAGVSGQAVVGFVVDTAGNVRDAYIVSSSHPGFDDAAVQALLKWKFKPGRKGGAPQAVRMTQPLLFTLDK